MGKTTTQLREESATEKLRAFFDTAEDDEITFQSILAQARVTLANAFDEVRHPAPNDSSEHAIDILMQAQRLIDLHRVMEDHLHDFRLTDRHHTLRQLYEAYYREGERDNRTRRMDHTPAFKNLSARFAEDFVSLRRAECCLRLSLKDPWRAIDQGHDVLRPEEFVTACFDAALRLETFYEDRVFGRHS